MAHFYKAIVQWVLLDGAKNLGNVEVEGKFTQVFVIPSSSCEIYLKYRTKR
jgi:hypothetical protein